MAEITADEGIRIMMIIGLTVLVGSISMGVRVAVRVRNDIELLGGGSNSSGDGESRLTGF